MLSSTERDRLKNRNSKDTKSQIRASNDARVKRKLIHWLEEDLDDVNLIIEKLREDQLESIFTDNNVYHLLDIISKIISIRDFKPVLGELGNPEEWKVMGHPEKCRVIDADLLDQLALATGYPGDFKKFVVGDGRGHTQPATEMDIYRMALLAYSLRGLQALYLLGTGNPVVSALLYLPFLHDPRLKDHIQMTEGEMKGIARVAMAVKNTEPKEDR